MIGAFKCALMSNVPPGISGTVWSSTDKAANAVVQSDPRILGATANGAGARATTFKDVSAGGPYGFACTPSGTGSVASCYFGLATSSVSLTATPLASGSAAVRPSVALYVDGGADSSVLAAFGDEIFFKVSSTQLLVYVNGVLKRSGSKPTGTVFAPFGMPGANNFVTLQRSVGELIYPSPASGVTMWG